MAIELGVNITELMLGEDKGRCMSQEDYSKLGIEYSQNEMIRNIKKLEKITLITLVVSLLMFMDVSYGYFSALLSWQIFILYLLLVYML